MPPAGPRKFLKVLRVSKYVPRLSNHTPRFPGFLRRYRETLGFSRASWSRIFETFFFQDFPKFAWISQDPRAFWQENEVLFFAEWQRSQAAPRPAQGHPGRLSEVASLRKRSHEFPTLFPGPSQGFRILDPRGLAVLSEFTGLWKRFLERLPNLAGFL